MPLPLFLAVTLPAFFFALLANLMLGPLLVELARDMHSSVAAVGQLAAVTSLPWAVLAPLAGPFSDRYGRRPLLLGGLAVTSVAVFASGFAWDYLSLAALRFLTGLGAAVVPPNCAAAVSDHVSAERQGYALSLMLSVFSLGALIGVPAVAYIAAAGGWQASFFAVGVALALVFFLFLAFFPGTARKKEARFEYGSYFAPLKASRRPWMLLAANFTERTSVTVALTYVAAFLIQTYSVPLSEVAPALSAVALGMLIGVVAGGPLTTRRFRLKVCAAAQAATGLVGLALFGASPGFLASAVVSGVLGFFTSIGRPTILFLVMDVAPGSRGTMSGLYAASNQSATVAGAALGGLVIGLGGYPALGGLALATGLAGAIVAGWLIGEKRSVEAVRQKP